MLRVDQSFVLPERFMTQVADKIMSRINDVIGTQRLINTPDIMDVKQLSVYLGVSERWIHDRVKNKSIPHYKLGGNLKFNLTDISKWLIEFKVPAVNKPPVSYLKMVA